MTGRQQRSRVLLAAIAGMLWLAVGASLFAQTTASPKEALQLGFASERQVGSSRFSEFRETGISLGSWNGSTTSLARPAPRFAMPAMSPTVDSSFASVRGEVSDAAGDIGFSRASRLNVGRDAFERGAGSTLTLTTGYFEDAAIERGGKPRLLTAQGRRGRWAFYGEFSKGSVTSKRVVPIDRETPPPAREGMAQILDSSNQTSETGRVAPAPNPESSPSLSADKVYLEAVYDFLPTVSGKVSYKRSVIDSLDQQKRLQVEGVVKTGPDTEIKAGYKNQTLPEVEQDSTTKDTQVWTEFILKF